MTSSTTPTLNNMEKTAVFFCSHHSGHINPISALVPLFEKAGWKVHFVSAKSRQTKLESLGDLTFHVDSPHHETLEDAVQAGYETRFGLPMTDMAKNGLFFEQILPATVTYLAEGDLVNRVRALQPDVVVSDVSALWGILTAQALHVPLITSCSCTLFDQDTLQGVFGYLRDLPISQPCVSWIQQNLDITYDALHSYMNESEFMISWSMASLQPPSRRDSPNVHYFGAALPATVEQNVQAMIAANADPALQFIHKTRTANPNVKVVYCTLGTVVGQEKWTIMDCKDGHDMVGAFYDRVMTALGNKDEYCVVLSIGTNRSQASMMGNHEIPKNFHIANFVPQLAILPLADVFITHVGNNSLHEAFFWGCPMLCVPVFGDQHPNAAAVERMGAGIHLASPFAPNPSPNLDHVTVAVLQQALERILVTQRTEIRTACVGIRQEMLVQHEAFHKQAWQEMEAFIEKQTAASHELSKEVPAAMSDVVSEKLLHHTNHLDG